MENKRYGMLVTLEATEKRYNNEVVWRFFCDCGEIVERSLSQVKRNTKLGYVCSCGKHSTENKRKASKENIEKVNKENLKENVNMSIIKKEGAYKNSKTGVKGVSWDKTRKKYHAQIAFQGKNYNLGRYNTIEEAKEAYQKKRKELLDELKGAGEDA